MAYVITTEVETVRQRKRNRKLKQLRGLLHVIKAEKLEANRKEILKGYFLKFLLGIIYPSLV